MTDRPSEPSIDIEAKSIDEQDRRIVALDADTVKIDKLGDTVRIKRTPRAQTHDREMLRQQWPTD